MASIVDKHKTLSETRGPKLVFAGGSNLVFGLNSQQIQMRFRLPVINLSLHAGLGTSFILNELKYSMKRGDIIFLSLEYLLESNGEYRLKKHVTKVFPEASNYYSVDIREEISSLLFQVRNDFLKFIESSYIEESKGPEIYTRSAFNKYGEIEIGSTESRVLNEKEKPRLSYHYWEGIASLNDFYRFAKAKGIDVYFFYPCFPSSVYGINKEIINGISDDLENDLLIEILGVPTDFVLSDSLFYDTIYHLNSSGRKIRTDKLVSLMESNSQVQNSILNIKNRVN